MFPLDLTNHFKAALKKNLSPGYLKEDLIQLGLSEEKAAWIAGKVKNHYNTGIVPHCLQASFFPGHFFSLIAIKHGYICLLDEVTCPCMAYISVKLYDDPGLSL